MKKQKILMSSTGNPLITSNSRDVCLFSLHAALPPHKRHYCSTNNTKVRLEFAPIM